MKVVVVGYGMAGARFVDQVRTHDPDVELTVLGAERHHAYNRVLLSTVLAGGLSVESVGLHDEYWADEEPDRPAARHRPSSAIDRAAKVVELADESVVDYDALVLATGSRAWMPRTLTGPDVTRVPDHGRLRADRRASAARRAGRGAGRWCCSGWRRRAGSPVAVAG